MLNHWKSQCPGLFVDGTGDALIQPCLLSCLTHASVLGIPPESDSVLEEGQVQKNLKIPNLEDDQEPKLNSVNSLGSPEECGFLRPSALCQEQTKPQVA